MKDGKPLPCSESSLTPGLDYDRAIAQIVAVVIGGATLWLMWWLDKQAHLPTTKSRATVPEDPISSWMPVLIAASMLGTGVLFFLGSRAQGQRPKRVIQPPMTHAEFVMSNQASARFSSLPWAARIGIRLIYQSPGLQVSTLQGQLETLGFCEVQSKIINPILESGLVDRHFSGAVYPSPELAIRQTIERLMQEQPIL